MYQSEAQLEKELIKQLTTLGFAKVSLPDKLALESNLRTQLEKFNQITLSNNEFAQITHYLSKGDRFHKAKTLRGRFAYTKDNGDTAYIRFFNMVQWCKNEYQVTHQVSQEGKYSNRYDVTLLINGLPLVQIELKRRGVEIKEGFNQINRYQKHSFAGTLFEYVQIFVISNGVNTKYFANNPKQSYEQTFYWTDKENNKITKLSDFATAFLEKCKVSEMIAEYIVLAESTKIPMILRPYQYYAARAIEQRVKESNKNGYVWHTTGSGKTLTSFKTSQILSGYPEVKKVLFVVDRKDLDIQTTKEFNSFSDGAVDGTDDTRNLVKQLKDTNPKKKLIVTTIQKLDRAIGRDSYRKEFEHLADEKIVIIFDECHRSQFGKTHAQIKNFFTSAQLIGFTGTPIFAENHVGKVTTKDVFEDCLHKYIITHAITDNNVLGFAVEYVGRYKKKDPDVLLDDDIFADMHVEGIDTKEVLESPERLEKITKYILQDWRRKTKNGKFNALFCVSRVDILKEYYKLLRKYKKDDFTIATIFTYKANEEQKEDLFDEDIFETNANEINQHSRDFLENCIQDYNHAFSTNFTTDRFYDYYKDLQKRVKKKEIDMVLVVNMFLTGFDSKRLNTLYIDKNLQYHGLIQAYSRTNRLFNSDKPHGNIVSFRNLKENTDKALKLYGDENAREIVFKKPYAVQKREFTEKLDTLRKKAPDVAAVDEIVSEKEQAEFVKAFRNLLRIKASLETYAEFKFSDLGISEQEFYDYQSKYLDLHDERKRGGREKESILDQIDFEIELTVRDLINFDYIIKLLAGLKEAKSVKAKLKKKEAILQIFERDVQLRKKKELIEKFIEEHLPNIPNQSAVEEAFDTYWRKEKEQKLKEISEAENISLEKLKKILSEYNYTNKLPKEQDIADSLPSQPPILQRKTILRRIMNSIIDFVDIFEW